MVSGSFLQHNFASHSGNSLIITGDVTYVFPPAPGTWIAARSCKVYRQACEVENGKGPMPAPNLRWAAAARDAARRACTCSRTQAHGAQRRRLSAAGGDGGNKGGGGEYPPSGAGGSGGGGSTGGAGGDGGGSGMGAWGSTKVEVAFVLLPPPAGVAL